MAGGDVEFVVKSFCWWIDAGIGMFLTARIGGRNGPVPIYSRHTAETYVTQDTTLPGPTLKPQLVNNNVSDDWCPN